MEKFEEKRVSEKEKSRWNYNAERIENIVKTPGEVSNGRNDIYADVNKRL